MKKNLIWVIVIILAAGGAFYGGMRYQQTKSASAQANSSGQRTGAFRGANGANGGGNFNAGGAAAGQIIAEDNQSITLKLSNGSSKIVFYSGSTQFEKMVSGTINDFPIGTEVVANGTANSDGSVTANTIQLRPNFPGRNASSTSPSQ